MCVYLFCGSRLEDFRRHVKRAAQAFQLRPWELLQGGDELQGEEEVPGSAALLCEARGIPCSARLLDTGWAGRLD